MAKDTGGPAFPNITPDMNVDGGPGMTLRQWYAGQALAGITKALADFNRTNPTMPEDVAILCVAFADALIAEEGKS